MVKVLSKLHVTVSKAVTDQYGGRPGDRITWIAAGGVSALCRARALGTL